MPGTSGRDDVGIFAANDGGKKGEQDGTWVSFILHTFVISCFGQNVISWIVSVEPIQQSMIHIASPI